MSKFEVISVSDKSANIGQLSVKREWMDQTYDAHAYHCYPVSTANTIGWTLSFPEDISFMWNGEVNRPGSVTILEGNDYVYTGRENQTVSFKTGLVFKTDENQSIFMYNPQNYFNENWETISAVISTSFFANDFPVAIRIKKPNRKITIKAGEPFVSFIPLSIGKIQETELDYYQGNFSDNRLSKQRSYGDVSQEINKIGKWTNFYRNATDEYENKIGNHEVKVLRLKLNKKLEFKQVD